jgi:hypothetical protein
MPNGAWTRLFDKIAAVIGSRKRTLRTPPFPPCQRPAPSRPNLRGSRTEQAGKVPRLDLGTRRTRGWRRWRTSLQGEARVRHFHRWPASARHWSDNDSSQMIVHLGRRNNNAGTKLLYFAADSRIEID